MGKTGIEPLLALVEAVELRRSVLQEGKAANMARAAVVSAVARARRAAGGDNADDVEAALHRLLDALQYRGQEQRSWCQGIIASASAVAPRVRS